MAARILFVCTANICRSPAAEHLARARAGEGLSFSSAGFRRSGVACPVPLVKEVARRGVDLSGHRSRRVSVADVADADLVVTMEARHVVDLSVLDPTAFPKTVPLKELVRLLGDGPLTVGAVLDELADRDPGQYLGVGSDDDVPDPYGGSARMYRQGVALIDSLVGTLVHNLVAPPPAKAPAGSPEPPALQPGKSAVAVELRPVTTPIEQHVETEQPIPRGHDVPDRHAVEEVVATHLFHEDPDRRGIEGQPAARSRHPLAGGHLVALALSVLVTSWVTLTTVLFLEGRDRVDVGQTRLEDLRQVDIDTLDVDAALADLDAARRQFWFARRNLTNPVMLPLQAIPVVGGELEREQAALRRSAAVTYEVTVALEQLVQPADGDAGREQARQRLQAALADLDRLLGDEGAS